MSHFCCCSLAGTKACETCTSNPMNKMSNGFYVKTIYGPVTIDGVFTLPDNTVEIMTTSNIESVISVDALLSDEQVFKSPDNKNPPYTLVKSTRIKELIQKYNAGELSVFDLFEALERMSS